MFQTTNQLVIGGLMYHADPNIYQTWFGGNPYWNSHRHAMNFTPPAELPGASSMCTGS